MKTYIVKDYYDSTKKNIKLHIDNDTLVRVEDSTEETDLLLFPAFIDIHTHGFKGYSTECNHEELLELALAYQSRGIGGFVATVGPRSYEEYEKIFDLYRMTFSGHYPGARFLGFHLEGPHLNKNKHGAIDPNNIYDINLHDFKLFIEKNKDVIKIISIAPEIENAIEAIQLLTKYGIIASAGHTAANFDETEIAIKSGLSHVTHTFNAMNSLHHRDPSLLTSVLLNDHVKCELIADGFHVNTNVIRLIKKLKPIETILIVSDSGEESGWTYPTGHQFQNGNIVNHGAIIQPDGVIAGSTKDILASIKDLVIEGVFNIDEIPLICSKNAAESLKFIYPQLHNNSLSFYTIVNKDFEIIDCLISK
ncbi:hypothetical protein [Anaerorhabdus sp.]|uniref:N-acetylglucosamine-6-phosphate deacetylase n=1 Tax=Anaerorhabdus sp. TaxID=1872524 RepID=UPI002B207993|nr:hypothetical protein [Anaerorhabdus sp.]MEA4876095.1 hypothetical protein [Anaerorhabdus sp.]